MTEATAMQYEVTINGSSDGVGAADANRFATEAEAWEAVDALKALGDDWADANYGVRVVR